MTYVSKVVQGTKLFHVSVNMGPFVNTHQGDRIILTIFYYYNNMFEGSNTFLQINKNKHTSANNSFKAVY